MRLDEVVLIQLPSLMSNYSKPGRVKKRRKWKERRRCKAGGRDFLKKEGKKDEECCHNKQENNTEPNSLWSSK